MGMFKRILHPVGQGAFFTEQLKNESTETVSLNVVYDCGSNTGKRKNKAPELVEKEIRNTYDDGEKIDLLFISHFDEDHTNGLESLVKQGLITKETKVIIPFRYPYLLIMMEENYSSLSRFVIQAYNIGATVIGIDDEDEEIRNLEEVDIEDLGNHKYLKIGTVIRKKKEGNPMWYFYPFMLSDPKSHQKEFIDEIKGAKKKGEDIDPQELDEPDKIIEKISILRKIYQGIGKRIGGVTKINVNSLLMLSFPAKNLFKRTCLWHFTPYYCSVGPACLYTGDSNLQGKDYDEVVNEAQDAINQFSSGTEVGLIQVPHHGSRRCFPPKMAMYDNEFAELAFVNCNPMHSQKIFDSSIIGEFISNYKELLLVTDEYHSRVEVIGRI